WSAAALTLSAAPARSQEAFTAVAERVNKKVVKVFGSGGFKGLVAYGTGVLVSPRGHILTSNNHILDTRGLRVHLYDGRQFSARVLFKEPELDVALIQVEGQVENLPFFDFAAAAKAPLSQPGDWVLAFTNQFEIATKEEPLSVQRGVVAAYAKL